MGQKVNPISMRLQVNKDWTSKWFADKRDYAKFLKDLCTVKRKLNVHKKAFLTEQVSSIIQHKYLPKYKDPGCPTISCVIGNYKVDRALLDLGASVNLLSYSVYKQLGLCELKPTSMTLQLFDMSVKISKRVVEDVLVQVNKILASL